MEETNKLTVEAIKPQYGIPVPRYWSLLDVTHQLIDLAIRSTKEHDWLNVDGHPYLTLFAAEKIGREFGVGMENIYGEKEWREDEKGRYYIYIYSATVYQINGDRSDASHVSGTCSQRDKIYSLASGKPRLLSNVEIDETIIKSAAYNDLVSCAITHQLGLTSLSWDQLKSAGINIDNIASVEFRRY